MRTESITSRRERIRAIEHINEVVIKYQGRALSPEDFNLLWELDHDQLIEVYNSMRETQQLQS